MQKQLLKLQKSFEWKIKFQNPIQDRVSATGYRLKNCAWNYAWSFISQFNFNLNSIFVLYGILPGEYHYLIYLPNVIQI